MNKIKAIYFCPHCRYKIITPKMLLSVNVSGNINLNCGNCNKDGKNSRGVVKIKGTKIKEES